jgi:hypothetical protein
MVSVAVELVGIVEVDELIGIGEVAEFVVTSFFVVVVDAEIDVVSVVMVEIEVLEIDEGVKEELIKSVDIVAWVSQVFEKYVIIGRIIIKIPTTITDMNNNLFDI